MKLKVLIVTSKHKSYGSVLLQHDLKDIEFCVLINTPFQKNGFQRIFRKIIKIGPAGLILGYWSRKWYQIEYPDIVSVAKQKNISVITSSGFKLTDVQLEYLKQFDLAISMGNGYIPKCIFSLFRLGMWNIHHEVLPDYPGAQSVVWPLIEGDTYTGYSIHKVTSKIDAGDLLLVEKREIKFESTFGDTVRTNYYETKQLSIDGLVRTLQMSPEHWTYHQNKASRSFTTPSLFQWIKAFRNYNTFKAKLIL